MDGTGDHYGQIVHGERFVLIVLYCIVLIDCIVLYCIVLYCIVLYCIVLYCIVFIACLLDLFIYFVGFVFWKLLLLILDCSLGGLVLSYDLFQSFQNDLESWPIFSTRSPAVLHQRHQHIVSVLPWNMWAKVLRKKK